MIRITRPPEPAALESERETALNELRNKIDKLAPDTKLKREDFPTIYKDYAEDLWRSQHRKCCYCELAIRLKGHDVEHYRPASRYWWLTYTWNNLLFACQNCNRWAKNDSFPLMDEGARLTPENPAPGDETPLILDPSNPSSPDPVDSIQFVLRKGQWRPTARDNSAYGAMTIVELDLDANDLLELYNEHVEELKEELKPLSEALSTQTFGSGHQDSWDRLVRRRLQPPQPFTALTYDALDHFFPAAIRSQYNLALPKPPYSRAPASAGSPEVVLGAAEP